MEAKENHRSTPGALNKERLDEDFLESFSGDIPPNVVGDALSLRCYGCGNASCEVVAVDAVYVFKGGWEVCGNHAKAQLLPIVDGSDEAMTPDIERLAKEAGYEVDDGFVTSPTSQTSGNDAKLLAKFAALVAEECDRELFRLAQLIPPNGEAHMIQREALFDGAQAIRAKFALSNDKLEAK